MGGVLHPIMKVFPMQIRANADDSARMMLKELKVLDDHLADRKYLFGESLTIADLLTVSFVGRGYAIFHGSWYDDYRHLSRWMELVYNMPENVAVMGPLQKMEFDIPEALKGRKYQAEMKPSGIETPETVEVAA
jgi:glutathione S-transferase